MEEIWKDISNYEGYQVSNLGRVRTYNKVTYTERHGERHWKDRIIKPKGKNYKTGYRVTLWKDGKPKDFLVCRLVATTFLEDLINSDMTVNHKNGNRFDNRIENLEWLSRADNIRYGFENGQYKQTKIILYTDFEEKEFRSLSQANLFLKRNKDYCGDRIKKGITTATSKEGKVYNIKI